jgi:LysM repeat protein
MKIARQWTGLHLAALGAMALLFMAGCTLSGSSGLGDVTPVSDTAATLPTLAPPTAIPATGTPELSDLEVLGTQAAVTATAQAAGATSEEATTDEGTPEAEEGTIISDDAGGEVTPPTNTPVGTPLAVEAASCPANHTVAGGENLYRIALRYGITYQELAAANGIANPAQISTGLVLKIPKCGQGGAPSTPSTGGQTTPSTTPGMHTVAAGENLYRIALRYNMTWTTLAAANGITNPDFIVVGQVLQIPG